MSNISDFEFNKVDGGYCVVRYNGFDDNVVVPDSFNSEPVVAIGVCSFMENVSDNSCHRKKNITLPKTIQIIGNQAFGGCIGLESVNIPDSVTEISKLAFWECESLSEIHLPKSLSKVETRTFEDCISLRKVTCDNADIECHRDAFSGCDVLSEIPLFMWRQLALRLIEMEPIVLNYIDDFDYLDEKSQNDFTSFIKKRKTLNEYLLQTEDLNLFIFLINNVNKLTLVDIEYYLEINVKRQTFPITSLLLDYKDKNFTKQEIDDYAENSKLVEIGLELPTLEQLEKKWCVKITKDYVLITRYKGSNTSEKIPSSLKDGKPIHFSFYDIMREVHLSFFVETLEFVTFDNGDILYLSIEKIGLSTIKEIVVPDGIKVISGMSFSMLSSLEKVVLPESLEYIEMEAFDGCSSLREINFPSSLVKIHSRAFNKCESLKNVVFTPKNDNTFALKEIGINAFGFTAIEEITLPLELENINKFPFPSCENLRRVNVSPKLVPLNKYYYDSCPNLEFLGLDGVNILDNFK